jgi:hypothetical protein
VTGEVQFAATVKRVTSSQKPDQDGAVQLVVDIAMQTTIVGDSDLVGRLTELQRAGAVVVTCRVARQGERASLDL